MEEDIILYALLYLTLILLTKTTVARNAVALSYHRVRGLYFLAVVFAAIIVYLLVTLSLVLRSLLPMGSYAVFSAS